MKQLISFLLFSFPALCMHGQSTADEQKKLINTIKKDNSYLYAEITTDDSQRACDLTAEMLDEEINRYVASLSGQGAESKGQEAMSKAHCISLPRGNMFRAFRYIKKSDITGAADSGSAGSETVASAPPLKTSTRREEAVKRLSALGQFNELEGCLGQMKADGHVTSFGKYATLTNPDRYVLIVYDKSGSIEALLSEGPERRNLLTGEADSVENYKGRGAIGVILAE